MLLIRNNLNLSVRWVDNSYGVHEDPLGLVCLTDANAATFLCNLKDSLHAFFPWKCVEVKHWMVLQVCKAYEKD